MFDFIKKLIHLISMNIESTSKDWRGLCYHQESNQICLVEDSMHAC
jgi:hypothetical protein